MTRTLTTPIKKLFRAAAIAQVALVVAASGALAQGANDSRLRPDVSKLYGRPGATINDRNKAALERLNRNPVDRLDSRSGLNLKENRSALQSPGAGAGSAAGADIGKYKSLDSNGDGAISQGEYFSGRNRQFGVPTARIGSRSAKRQQQYNARLQSNFRRADRNRDGKVSTQELKGLKNPRF